MKFTYNWLKEFVDIDVPVAELVNALVSVGIEVASVKKWSIPPGVKVARVLTKEKHPDADKLSLCAADIGEPSPLAIVCGAPNVAAGMTVACATVGTQLAPDFVIKKAKIRGAESFGMFCSEKELGISDDHSGLMPLPDDLKPGTSLCTVLPDDYQIEVELTPNRGDCWSVIGIAREMAAAFGKPLKPLPGGLVESAGNINDRISVEIKDAEGCPRYMGRLIQGIAIKPSPLWLKVRICAAGLRPINNIVDVTNYIMVEYGQPQHAFDYSRIGGSRIIVQRASEGLKFSTLDNTERTLKADDLLICDAQRAVALAGIMGGAGSAIADTTTDVFLECAYFNPVTIRKTSKRLGLQTDSSSRFERGVDPAAGLEQALDRAARLMAELGGGRVVAGIVDAYPTKLSAKRVSIRPSRVERVLGVAIGSETIVDILTRLGMRCIDKADPAVLTIEVPRYRHDIGEEIDLIEEVGRHFGYDKIPTGLSARVNLTQNLSIPEHKTRAIRAALAYFGLHEAVSNSMTPEKWRAAYTPQSDPVVLLNPLNPDMIQMRTAMLGSVLQSVSHNLNHRNQNNRFFDLGKTYRCRPGQPLPVERWVVGIAIEGNWTPAAWNASAQPVSFSLVKGIVDALADHAGIGTLTYGQDPGERSFFDAEFAGFCSSEGVAGAIGKLSAKALQVFDIKSTVYYAELDVTDFLNKEPVVPTYSPLPRFPALERDFCFVMADTIVSEQVCAELRSVSDLVEEVRPFDVYRGDKLGAGLKSIAYSVRFRAKDRTLTDKEAEGLSTAIVGGMKSKFGMTLRQ